MRRGMSIAMTLVLLSACVRPGSSPTSEVSPLKHPIATQIPSSTREHPRSPVEHETATVLGSGTPAETLPVRDQSAVQEVIHRLAERLDTLESEVSVVRVFRDEFPAQNLGCPPEKGGEISEWDQPAFVTGQEIVLEANDHQYRYRVHGGKIVYCGQVP
jgi:hypothetical protein